MRLIVETSGKEELAEKLSDAGVEPAVIEKIMEGGEAILRSTKPEKKADWMRDAMKRMNSLLDLQTRRAVRESCACCLGGKRLKLSKEIARTYSTLEDRIEAAARTPLWAWNRTWCLRRSCYQMPAYFSL